MTRKLYYEDAYLRTFPARVLSCEPKENWYEVILDQTAFYPEGGGQPADQGELGGVRVLDVRQRGETIVHRTDRPLMPDQEVTGTLDWVRRFDHMQQHSGEHIVSGLICAAFGCDNVGFHLGKDIVTIDFNASPTWEELREIEERANRLVWENLPVEIGFYEGEALEALQYRSKKPLEGAVRIVSFPGADVCACCGTHVAWTGEVGPLRFLSVHPLRGGVRIELVAGERAYRYLTLSADANRANSGSLAVPEGQTPQALRRVMEDYEGEKYRATQLENRLFQALAAALTGPQLLFEPDLSPDALRRLCLAVSGRTGERCAAFSGEEGNYKYALYLPQGDREEVKKMNTALHGKGGGRDGLSQGSVAASRREIEAYFG